MVGGGTTRIEPGSGSDKGGGIYFGIGDSIKKSGLLFVAGSHSVQSTGGHVRILSGKSLGFRSGRINIKSNRNDGKLSYISGFAKNGNSGHIHIGSGSALKASNGIMLNVGQSLKTSRGSKLHLQAGCQRPRAHPR